MAETKIGFDTGFFIKTLQGNITAVDVWKKIRNNKATGFVSCLTLFEIKRLMLKGAIDRVSSEILLEDINASCQLLWIDEEDTLLSSAKISHSNGIPAIDSLILASLLKAGTEIIYTTDSHFYNYKKKGVSIIQL